MFTNLLNGVELSERCQCRLTKADSTVVGRDCMIGPDLQRCWANRIFKSFISNSFWKTPPDRTTDPTAVSLCEISFTDIPQTKSDSPLESSRDFLTSPPEPGRA